MSRRQYGERKPAGYANFFGHDAVIHVYDAAGNGQ